MGMAEPHPLADILGQIVRDEGAHLVAKRQFIRREAQIHGSAPLICPILASDAIANDRPRPAFLQPNWRSLGIARGFSIVSRRRAEPSSGSRAGKGPEWPIYQEKP